jgi:hypothetical protein
MSLEDALCPKDEIDNITAINPNLDNHAGFMSPLRLLMNFSTQQHIASRSEISI